MWVSLLIWKWMKFMMMVVWMRRWKIATELCNIFIGFLDWPLVRPTLRNVFLIRQNEKLRKKTLCGAVFSIQNLFSWKYEPLWICAANKAVLVFAEAVDDVSEYRVVIMNVGLWELKFIDLDHFFIRGQYAPKSSFS